MIHDADHTSAACRHNAISVRRNAISVQRRDLKKSCTARFQKSTARSCHSSQWTWHKSAQRLCAAFSLWDHRRVSPQSQVQSRKEPDLQVIHRDLCDNTKKSEAMHAVLHARSTTCLLFTNNISTVHQHKNLLRSIHLSSDWAADERRWQHDTHCDDLNCTSLSKTGPNKEDLHLISAEC